MSKWNEKGEEIKDFKFPFQLVFTAPEELKTMFPADFEKDFTDQLLTVPQGSLLFKVFARAEPKSDLV
jgi:hypothetical protein